MKKMLQTQSIKQNFGFQIKFAKVLEMPEDKYAELICKIESNPLFIKLKYPENSSDKAIFSRKQHRANLCGRFLEIKEDLIKSSGDTGSELEKLINSNEEILDVIRNVGEEKFCLNFIQNDDSLSIRDIADNCSITIGQVHDILNLINTVDLYGEFLVHESRAEKETVFYKKIAAIEEENGKYRIRYTSIHWARGVYKIDYDKVRQLISEKMFSESESAEINRMLETIEKINIKKNLLHHIITNILSKQARYLKTGDLKDIIPVFQKNTAAELGVSPSMISRAVAGRLIVMPWGGERPLRTFFVSPVCQKREKACEYINEIINEEIEKLKAGKPVKPLSDEAIAGILFKKFKVDISKRTVAKYRNSLNLPGSFLRK